MIEVRYNDVLTERLIRQVWDDFQTKLNNEAAVNDVVIDPLDVDAQLPKPISITQKGSLLSHWFGLPYLSHIPNVQEVVTLPT